MIRFTNIIIGLLFLGIFTPLTTFAAFDLITIKTNPTTPGPNQDVTISIESYAVDLNSARIVWSVDKEAAKEGVAEKSFVAQTGDFGTQTVVDISIFTIDGARFDKQIILAPAEVDLLWEAQTYTPPFYKGKAMPTFKSLIKVTAMPRFNSFSSDPAQYYYKWTFNRTLNAGEALSKNSVIVPAAWENSSININVETSIPGAPWKGGKNLTIPSVGTKIVFYEEAPLLGTEFNNAYASDQPKAGNEFTLRAVPYFFSLDNITNGDLLSMWTVNRNSTLAGLDPMTLTLSKSSKAAESFAVALSVQNTKRILQKAAAQTTISFAQEQ